MSGNNSFTRNRLRNRIILPGSYLFRSVYFFRHRYSIIPILLLFLAGCASVPEDVPDQRDRLEEDVQVSRDDAPALPTEDSRRVPDQDETPPPELYAESAVVAVLPPGVAPERIPEPSDPLRPLDPPDPIDLIEQAIGRTVAAMTIPDLAGQLIMPALPVAPEGGATLRFNQRVRQLLEDVRPGGIILFGGNIRDSAQVRSLVEELQAHSPIPLLVAVDQEGGVVSRLTSSEAMDATVVPSARRVGLVGDEELAYQVARATARELRSLGITMNFAPVADILTNPGNAVIGTRAFGNDPLLVARMVAATVRGLQDEGVSAVIKHFPGHGDTREDTHIQAVVVPHTMERLRQVEFIPFREGVLAGADGVMTAHITLPEVAGESLPVTLSPALLRDVLRHELDFSGLIVTDSLVMAALTRYFPEDQLPLRAFQAGADLLLYPRRPEVARQLLVAAVEAGEISRDDLEESVTRILRVKFARELMLPVESLADETFPAYRRPERFVPEEESMRLGVAEHRELMQRVLQLSTQVLTGGQ